jgi:hypothetical protein
MTLTVFGKDQTKRKITLSPAFMYNEKGRKVSISELEDKAKSVAQSLEPYNYFGHHLDTE